MKSKFFRILPILLALTMLVGTLMLLPTGVSAEDTFDPNHTNEPQPSELTQSDATYVSHLYWTDCATLSGNTVGRNTNNRGEPIVDSNGTTFPKGIGLHASTADYTSYVELNIDGLGYTQFASFYGVCTTQAADITMASLKFAVFGDGEKIWESDVMTHGTPMARMECDITGVKVLRLALAGDASKGEEAIWGGWGNWGGAIISKSGEITDEMLLGGLEVGEGSKPTDPNHTNAAQPEEFVKENAAYISDLYWTDSYTLPGNTLGRDVNAGGEAIYDANGSHFSKGIGLHASSADFTSFIELNIDGLGYTKFASYYGVCTSDSRDISMASLKFAVYGDGELLWESDVMAYGVAMNRIDCDITGVKTLRLAVAGDAAKGEEEAIWGGWGCFGGAVLAKTGEITDEMLGEVVLPETDPETDLATESETNPVTEPDTDPVTQPETDPATEPETTPATEPDTTPDMTPDTDAESKTESDTEAETSAGTATDTSDAGETEKTDEGGCASLVALGGIVMATALVAGVVVCRRKED